MSQEPEPIVFYAVRNNKGGFYRSYAVKKRSGAWVKNVVDAKVYTKAGPARGMVTRFQRDNTFAELVMFIAREA